MIDLWSGFLAVNFRLILDLNEDCIINLVDLVFGLKVIVGGMKKNSTCSTYCYY